MAPNNESTRSDDLCVPHAAYRSEVIQAMLSKSMAAANYRAITVTARTAAGKKCIVSIDFKTKFEAPANSPVPIKNIKGL